MTFEGLPQEAITALLSRSTKPKSVRRAIQRTCELCNATLQNGYCPSTDCANNPYADDRSRECTVCGYCETPGNCVWTVVCPICGVGTGQHCNINGRLVGIHDERWTKWKKTNLIPSR